MLRHRLPLLVTGVAGVAGFNAFHALHRLHPGEVIGIRPRQTWKLVGPGIVAQDAEDSDGMRSLFDRFGFRAVLNCVGNCALKSCELDPAMAHVVNVQSARVLRRSRPPTRCPPRSSLQRSRLLRHGRRQPRRNRSDRSGHRLWQDDGAGRERAARRTCRGPRSCASRCRWGRASIDMPARSTGFNPVSAPIGQRRCISMKSEAAPIATI